MLIAPKTVKDANCKFGVHVSRNSPDMTFKNFEKGDHGQGHMPA